MPSTITHAYFANDVYNKMSIPTKELLLDHKEMLKTSAQNTDVLFFYNIANLVIILKKIKHTSFLKH